MNPKRAHDIAALRAAARRRLPKLVFDYIDGGAEDGICLRANRQAFRALRFAPRTLVDVSQRSQSTSLLGQSFDCPFGIAPLGAAGLCWHDAEIALARAARAANVPFILSTHSLAPLERVTAEAGYAPWFQLYMPRDRSAAERMVARASDAGCDTLVLTTDVPVGGNRGYDAHFRLGLRTILDGLLHPRWLAGVYLRRNWEIPRHWSERRDTQSWEDLAWLRRAWRRKLLVKGILCAEDAARAVSHGVDGIVVSNHGGRQLDGAPASLEALAPICAAVGHRTTIILDGGVRRGADVVKALALGADFVLVGRAALYGASAAGEAGVRRALEILRGEVDRVLALLGRSSIAELDASVLVGADVGGARDGREHRDFVAHQPVELFRGRRPRLDPERRPAAAGVGVREDSR